MRTARSLFMAFTLQGTFSNSNRRVNYEFAMHTFLRESGPNLKVGFLTEGSRLSRFLNKMKFNMRKWRHLPLRDQAKLINQRLTGHFNYYGIISNYPALKRVYYQTLLYWRKVLSSRSQRGRLTWEKYRKILKAYPLRTPKIRIGFDRMDQLAFS